MFILLNYIIMPSIGQLVLRFINFRCLRLVYLSLILLDLILVQPAILSCSNLIR
jgi:hypothetical protein